VGRGAPGAGGRRSGALVSGRKRATPERPRLHFAGVVIEGAPGGGTFEDAQRLVVERVAKHVAREVPAALPRATEAAD
jgi:hypothetical protein